MMTGGGVCRIFCFLWGGGGVHEWGAGSHGREGFDGAHGWEERACEWAGVSADRRAIVVHKRISASAAVGVLDVVP